MSAVEILERIADALRAACLMAGMFFAFADRWDRAAALYALAAAMDS